MSKRVAGSAFSLSGVPRGLAVLVAAGSVAGAIAACGSSSSDGGGTTPDDGGSSGDDATTTGDDGGAADTGIDAEPIDEAGCVVPASAGAFCHAYACPGAGCNKTPSCQFARANQCSQAAAAESDAFRAALVDCSSKVFCTDIQGSNDCLFGEVEAAPRTTAETKLAADVCAACPGDAGATACASAFYAKDSAVGLTLLLYSDAVLANVDSQCATKCDTDFVTCALGITSAADPPNPSDCK